jgi:hypothetical protein
MPARARDRARDAFAPGPPRVVARQPGGRALLEVRPMSFGDEYADTARPPRPRFTTRRRRRGSSRETSSTSSWRQSGPIPTCSRLRSKLSSSG